MSGPMASLRKSRKTPLPVPGSVGHKGVPFRQDASPSYTVDESKLLDEITSNMAQMNRPAVNKIKEGPRTHHAHNGSTGGTGTNDHELMSAMMSRLAQLEQRIQFQAKEILAKDKKIRILEDKVRILNKARDDGNPGRVQELEKKCLLLQQHVHEMEAFLSDYGMIWVGQSLASGDVYNEEDLETLSAINNEDVSSTVWKPANSVAGSDLKVDYDQILQNIQELNVLAGEGIAKIQHTTDGARLKMPDPVPLTLYGNGIVLYSGPFRPFSDPTTQETVNDLMDGYFPSELQTRYPDGIPFSVTDKRNVYFKDKHNREVFHGTGQVLGGDTKPSRLVPSNLDKSTLTKSPPMEEESELPGPKMSVEQFLKRLPQSVVRDGKIIDIRGSLGETLKGGDSMPIDVTVVETAAVQEMKDRLKKSETERPPSSREVTTLRIKSEQGDQTYILKMKFSETIGEVREYLKKQRPKGAPNFEIVSAFPNKVFAFDAATLQDCGLVPNAALHLRAVKK